MRLDKYPDKQISVKAALAQLKTMLASARTLDHFTPEMLARTHRVSVRQCEYELTIERQRRERAA